METRIRSNTLQSVNPANLHVIGEVAYSSHDDIVKKIKLAHQAKKIWKDFGIKKRIAILTPLIEAFKAREKDIISLTTREMGKIITESRNDFKTDFAYFEAFLREGPQYIEDEITFSQGKAVHRIIYEPRGVVACIVPWNFPLSNFIWAVIPNLVVGNTIVIKHSEECPLLGRLFEEIMLSLPNLPEGVFAAIHGDSETGAILAAQDIDMIWFIGSSAVGRKLFELAGKKQIKTILEMGGSNPAILFDDVDVDALIPAIYHGRFLNCGQVCDASKRLIVHQSIHDEVIQKLSQHIQHIKIGNPENETTELGPLVAMRQLNLLESQMQDAISRGATVITGGKRPENLPGAYYLPTLVSNVKREMRIWKEEVFGPVLPLFHLKARKKRFNWQTIPCMAWCDCLFTDSIARRVAAKLMQDA